MSSGSADNTSLHTEMQLILEDAHYIVDAQQWITLAYIFALPTVGLIIYYYMWLPINWVQGLSDVGYHHIAGASRGRRSKKDVVEEVRRRRLLGDLPPVYPNGWFALLESSKLKAGQVKHVQALGKNYAVMRTDSGQVHVLDAYCPHLGANIAVGGVVKGDCLECPFHGWQFRGEDGNCSHIPYSDKVPKTASVKKWTSVEVNNIVFVWYHAEGEPPSWQVQSIPDIESGKLWYRGRAEIIINAHLQDILENLADFSHFGAIHSPSVFAGSDISSYHSFVHSFLKHVWNVVWKQHLVPEEAHMCTLYVNHKIKLFNKFTVIPKYATTTQIGPGCALVKNDGFRSVFTFTPLEPLVTRMVLLVYTPPLLFLLGGFLLYTQLTMAERDAMVFNHKKYLMKPKLVKEEESLRRYRRWFNQFYTENSPRVSFQHNNMEW